MSRVRAPWSSAPVPPPRRTRWRRLAMTVLGVGGLAGLLVLALLAVGYFLPAPLLVVPVAVATAVVVYVTDRSRKAEAGPVVPLPGPRTVGSEVVRPAVVPEPRRSAPAWPTGRRRRSVTTGASVGFG